MYLRLKVNDKINCLITDYPERAGLLGSLRAHPSFLVALHAALRGDARISWLFRSLAGLGFFFVAAGRDAMRVTYIGAMQNEMDPSQSSR